ncbi:purine-nucleoside phosphorylase [Fibrobacterota bacterium]
MTTLPEKIEEASKHIKGSYSGSPKIGIILGSGLGALVNSINIEKEVSYDDIPHFVKSTVEFHAGKLIFGELSGKPVVAMQGRFHFYEGYSMEEITFPVRVMKALGVETLIVSNACGGLNPQFTPGDIMLITDHINLLGQNPLIGKNFNELGPRYPDMSEPYCREFIKKVIKGGLKQGIQVQKGVFACMTGPSLETAAEYRMLRVIGADVIGMSTVPEVIAAVHAGLKVLGLSVITDSCLPDNLEPVDIQRIIKTAEEAEPKLVALIKEFIKDV